MRKTLTTSSLIEPLTDEQIKKRATGVEFVDQKGLVSRHRVLDQTLFDMLFLQDLISQAQHEGAHLFMDAIARSGASIRSANLDVEVFTEHRAVGNILGERHMAFSSAYRGVVRVCGDSMASRAMRFFASPYTYPSCEHERKLIAGELVPVLDALAIHYRISAIEDPRDVVRSMAGVSKKKRGRG